MGSNCALKNRRFPHDIGVTGGGVQRALARSICPWRSHLFGGMKYYENTAKIQTEQKIVQAKLNGWPSPGSKTMGMRPV